ncbi:MAG: lysophospholipid acyltransferase family protein [Stagnimonas sp.]|nr:lysophospholipid acyltransferase family protein [Stagnimonas sp.]
MLFLFRCLRLICHVALGLVLASLIKFDFTRRIDADDWARRWLKRLMRILGIRFSIHGSPVEGGQMIVCNHVSWLDIPLVGAALCNRFVAKSEIQHWPVAGALANCIGTFYIRRGPGGSRPLLEKLRPHLHGGGSVVIFPEGTTTAGREVLPFHPRLFQAALDAGCPVQPVALRYGRAADGRDLAPFIGDDDLVSHIVRLLKAPGLSAELHYCVPVFPEALEDRHGLARRAEDSIRRRVAPEATFRRPALLEASDTARAA